MQKVSHARLSNYTSFGTGGPAELLITLEKTTELARARLSSYAPFWFLGAGANVLISDEGLPGTTFRIQTSNLHFAEEEGFSIIIADAGVNWDTLVKKSIEHNKWGLERMSGIPGTVGAAVIGNIAAYGQAVSDSLLWVEVVDISQPQPVVKRLPAQVLGLTYRSSDFQKKKFKNYLIINAAFVLVDEPLPLEYDSALKIAHKLKLNPDKLSERRKIIMEARRVAGSLLDKSSHKTAGSFFRNPKVTAKQAEELIKFEEHHISSSKILQQNKLHGGSASRVSAAHVLLAAGFHRGQTWGPVRLHPEHILKIENTGGATSQAIYDVSQEIIQTVKKKLDITLTPEVRMLGKFK